MPHPHKPHYARAPQPVPLQKGRPADRRLWLTNDLTTALVFSKETLEQNRHSPTGRHVRNVAVQGELAGLPSCLAWVTMFLDNCRLYDKLLLLSIAPGARRREPWKRDDEAQRVIPIDQRQRT